MTGCHRRCRGPQADRLLLCVAVPAKGKPRSRGCVGDTAAAIGASQPLRTAKTEPADGSAADSRDSCPGSPGSVSVSQWLALFPGAATGSNHRAGPGSRAGLSHAMAESGSARAALPTGTPCPRKPALREPHYRHHARVDSIRCSAVPLSEGPLAHCWSPDGRFTRPWSWRQTSPICWRRLAGYTPLFALAT